jgi:hypothetical protein
LVDARRETYRIAARAASRAGFVLNVHITVSWTMLGIDDAHGAELALWRSLRTLAKSGGFPWLAIRAPERAGRGGRHVHILCHAPDDAARLAIIGLIAEKTGAPRAWLHLDGKRLQDCGRRIEGIMAKSDGGHWLAQRNVDHRGGIEGLVDYLPKADGKAKVGGQHRMSGTLAALVRQATAHTSNHGALHVLSKKTPAPEGAGDRREGANARTAA